MLAETDGHGCSRGYNGRTLSVMCASSSPDAPCRVPPDDGLLERPGHGGTTALWNLADPQSPVQPRIVLRAVDIGGAIRRRGGCGRTGQPRRRTDSGGADTVPASEAAPTLPDEVDHNECGQATGTGPPRRRPRSRCLSRLKVAHQAVLIQSSGLHHGVTSRCIVGRRGGAGSSGSGHRHVHAAAAPAGATAVIEVAELTVNDVAAVAPNLTAVAPLKLVPVMVTRVPPAVGPPVGLRPVTVAGTK